MSRPRSISTRGIAAIVVREGVRLKAYPDPATHGPPWTIGIGHTGPDVHPLLKITMGRARALLRRDLDPIEAELVRLGVPAVGMFDSLCSFGINLGVGIFGTDHTIGQLLHAKRWDKVGDAMLLYDVAGGRHMLGLLNRRKSERRQYNRSLRRWRRG